MPPLLPVSRSATSSPFGAAAITSPTWRPGLRPGRASTAVVGLDAVALGLTAIGLALLGLASLVVPQRLAQRPAGSGVMTIHLQADGALRIWNQPLAAQDLQTLLRRAERRAPGIRVRLMPEPNVPWGLVQNLMNRLDAPHRRLELQLP